MKCLFPQLYQLCFILICCRNIFVYVNLNEPIEGIATLYLQADLGKNAHHVWSINESLIVTPLIQLRHKVTLLLGLDDCRQQLIDLTLRERLHLEHTVEIGGIWHPPVGQHPRPTVHVRHQGVEAPCALDVLVHQEEETVTVGVARQDTDHFLLAIFFLCLWTEFSELLEQTLPELLPCFVLHLYLVHPHHQREASVTTLLMNNSKGQTVQGGGFASPGRPTQQDRAGLLTHSHLILSQKIYQVLHNLI